MRKVEVKGFFFFSKLLLHGLSIFIHGGVIVVAVTGGNFVNRALKMSLQRNSFCTAVFSAMEISWGETFWWVPVSRGYEPLGSVVPMSGAICILATQPSNEVSVVEMEAQECASVHEGMVHWESVGESRRCTYMFECRNGGLESMPS
jgi:hypothetical protein